MEVEDVGRGFASASVSCAMTVDLEAEAVVEVENGVVVGEAVEFDTSVVLKFGLNEASLHDVAGDAEVEVVRMGTDVSKKDGAFGGISGFLLEGLNVMFDGVAGGGAKLLVLAVIVVVAT